MQLRPPNVLILDEPTNHLDIESREALEDALRAFAGAILLVSHDRALLDAVGSRTVAVEDGALRSYQGGWAEYVRVARGAPGEERAAASRAPSARAGAAPAAGAPRRERRRRAAAAAKPEAAAGRRAPRRTG